MLLCIHSSCYKSSEEISTSDRSLVLTSFDTSYDFQGIRTFSLADSVVRLADGAALEDEGQYDTFILSQIRQELLDLGYSEVINPGNNEADIVVVVYTNTEDTYETGNRFCFWGGWSWYEWFDGWAYGQGYCWFYSFPVVVNVFESGTLFINMIDPDDTIEENQEVPSFWFGVVNGMLTSTVDTEERIREGISQLFNQSPYFVQ